MAERDGEVVLAKVDVDTNTRVAASFQVQSIPAVYAVRNKKVVSGFIGAQPEATVRAWLAEVAPAPTEVDQLIAAGDEASLRKAVALEPANSTAIISLASVLIAKGTSDGNKEALHLSRTCPRDRRSAPPVGGGTGWRRGCGGDDAVTGKLDALLTG